MLSSQSTCSLAMTQPTLGRDAAAEGLEYHNRDTCLGCMRVRSNKHKNASGLHLLLHYFSSFKHTC